MTTSIKDQEIWYRLSDIRPEQGIWFKTRSSEAAQVLEALWEEIKTEVELLKERHQGSVYGAVRCITLTLEPYPYSEDKVDLEIELEERGRELRFRTKPIQQVSMWGSGSSIRFEIKHGKTTYQVRLLVKVHYKNKK